MGLKQACALFFAGCCVATTAGAQVAAKSEVVAFNASVRVEVDAAGKPVSVKAPEDLPAPIRAFIEKRVAAWQYMAAKDGGQAVPAVTFVNVGACAIPAGAGFRLGLDFKGNGPRLISASGRLPPPSYPFEAQRSAVSGTYRVTYAILADGTTRVDSVDAVEGRGRHAKAFRTSLEQWAEALRYEPELVNGKPVSTSMSIPVEFSIGTDRRTGAAWRKAYLDELKARAIASSECIAAAGAETPTMPLAQDSPVKVVPLPAS